MKVPSDTQTPPRRRFRRDDESGLTTLEWLLIVAAVAGLAALAVVLVTNVVDDTAEQIGGTSARKTAAEVAAAKVTSDARSENTSATNTLATLNKKYKDECNRIKIIYSDIEGLETIWSKDITGSTPTASDVTDWTDKKLGCHIG